MKVFKQKREAGLKEVGKLLDYNTKLKKQIKEGSKNSSTANS